MSYLSQSHTKPINVYSRLHKILSHVSKLVRNNLQPGMPLSFESPAALFFTPIANLSVTLGVNPVNNR